MFLGGGVSRFTRWAAAGLLLGFLHGAASAQFSEVQTKELRLLYLDPFQTYLVPHVAACFNSASVASMSRSPFM